MPIFENRRRRAQRRFLAEADRQTIPQHCQALTVPLPEASADMLWANLSLSRADDILPVLKNWATALKTDGLLFFTHFAATV